MIRKCKGTQCPIAQLS